MGVRRIKKPYRVRRKKSIFRSKFFWFNILFLLITGGFIYLFFFSSLFQLKEIHISGNQKINESEIENLIKERASQNFFSLLPTNSIILVNLGKIKKDALETFPQISEISLKREWPNKLVAEAKERKPVAILCKNDRPCFYIDEEGVIFEEIFQVDPGYLLIKNLIGETPTKLGETVIEKEVLGSLLDTINQLERNFKIEIAEFIIYSSERLNAKTSEGWQIYINLKGDLSWQLTKLNLVLEKEIPFEKRGNLEYIDLRFSRVYYKYK